MTRPGGAALNSGQVFGKRAAVAIKRSRVIRKGGDADPGAVAGALRESIAFAIGSLEAGPEALDVSTVRNEIQARMSDHAGIVCTAEAVHQALEDARALRRRVAEHGLRVSSPAMLVGAFRWRHMAAVSEAVLTALDYYIAHGGGSRGARAICSPKGTRCPEAKDVDLSEFRFIEEQPKDKEEKLVVRPAGDHFEVEAVPVDRTPQVTREFFEKGWGPFLIKEG
ncbi:MAG: hypothetical protein D6773_14955 [Alphaproteobacteria bacterium]|nr:MAG: hypothetical protein D6773_14955 [Alphaproteobacteria bacterium]